MKVSKKKIDKELRAKAVKVLFEKLQDDVSVEDTEKFLNTFFKSEEKNLVLKKAAVMVLLSEGEKYRNIEERLEVSKATISNIRDIFDGRGYGGKDPNRKKSPIGTGRPQPKGWKKFKMRYKGAPTISELLSD